MRRRKPPGQRKAEEYLNEYRRKPRNNSKEIELRSRRRKIKQVFPAQPYTVESEEADAMTTEATPVLEHDPWYRHSYPGLPLAEHLRRSRHRRLIATGRHFFRHPYTPEVRKPFGRFLENMLAGGTGDSVELARLFQGILDHSGTTYRYWPARSAWLQDFLRDEPHWEPRLRTWITRILGSNR